jgi:hypothetical protein
MPAVVDIGFGDPQARPAEPEEEEQILLTGVYVPQGTTRLNRDKQPVGPYLQRGVLTLISTGKVKGRPPHPEVSRFFNELVPLIQEQIDIELGYLKPLSQEELCVGRSRDQQYATSRELAEMSLSYIEVDQSLLEFHERDSDNWQITFAVFVLRKEDAQTSISVEDAAKKFKLLTHTLTSKTLPLTLVMAARDMYRSFPQKFAKPHVVGSSFPSPTKALRRERLEKTNFQPQHLNAAEQKEFDIRLPYAELRHQAHFLRRSMTLPRKRKLL